MYDLDEFVEIDAEFEPPFVRQGRVPFPRHEQKNRPVGVRGRALEPAPGCCGETGGNGGQYVIGISELDLAIVFFGGSYGQAATHLIKKKHVPDYIIRSVEEGASPNISTSR